MPYPVKLSNGREAIFENEPTEQDIIEAESNAASMGNRVGANQPPMEDSLEAMNILGGGEDEYPMLVNRVTGEKKFASELDALKAKQKYSATGSNLQEVSPEVVQGLVDYTLDLSKVASLRGNQRVKLAEEAKKIDPSFDMKEYPARAAFVKDLSSGNGKMFQQVTSANTLIGHLGYMDEKIDQMKNANLKPANVVINLAKELTGDPSITNYAQAASVVDSELERLLTGVGVTQEALAFRRTILNRNSGFKQQKEAVKTLVGILESRSKALETQYKRVLKKDPEDNIIFPESREILKKLRGAGEDKREAYNRYRAQGKSPEEAKKLVGL